MLKFLTWCNMGEPAPIYSLVPGEDEPNPLCLQTPSESYAEDMLKKDTNSSKSTFANRGHLRRPWLPVLLYNGPGI